MNSIYQFDPFLHNTGIFGGYVIGFVFITVTWLLLFLIVAAIIEIIKSAWKWAKK